MSVVFWGTHSRLFMFHVLMPTQTKPDYRFCISFCCLLTSRAFPVPSLLLVTLPALKSFPSLLRRGFALSLYRTLGSEKFQFYLVFFCVYSSQKIDKYKSVANMNISTNVLMYQSVTDLHSLQPRRLWQHSYVHKVNQSGALIHRGMRVFYLRP